MIVLKTKIHYTYFPFNNITYLRSFIDNLNKFDSELDLDLETCSSSNNCKSQESSSRDRILMEKAIRNESKPPKQIDTNLLDILI